MEIDGASNNGVERFANFGTMLSSHQLVVLKIYYIDISHAIECNFNALLKTLRNHPSMLSLFLPQQKPQKYYQQSFQGAKDLTLEEYPQKSLPSNLVT